MPLKGTINDFWRMVTQYKCTTIVLLNQLTDDNKVCDVFIRAGTIFILDVSMVVFSVDFKQSRLNRMGREGIKSNNVHSFFLIFVLNFLLLICLCFIEILFGAVVITLCI